MQRDPEPNKPTHILSEAADETWCNRDEFDHGLSWIPEDADCRRCLLLVSEFGKRAIERLLAVLATELP